MIVLTHEPGEADKLAEGAYETVIANRASELPRRPRPDSVTDVLDWATEPLATAETALIMQLDLEQTRNALTNVGHLHPAGADG